MSEPSDNHIYQWVFFYSETFRTFRQSVNFYLTLLKNESEKLIQDDEVAALFSEDELHRTPIFKEIQNFERFLGWFDSIIDKGGENAIDYDTNISHNAVRIIKSCTTLYCNNLKNKRNKIASDNNVSKALLQTLDQKIESIEESTKKGVFEGATPKPLLVDQIAIESIVKEEHVDSVNSLSNPQQVRPRYISSIEIFDDELKSRCLDLLNEFSSNGENHRLDTVITEATRILENRIKEVSKVDDTGVSLVAKVFSAKSPVLRVSENQSEQEGAMALYRGIFGFIRNKYHHNMVDSLTPGRAIQMIGQIDYLLYVLETARIAQNEPST